MRCLFGHKKIYGNFIVGKLCPQPHSNHYLQVKWMCMRCSKTGIECLDEGKKWRVVCGVLVCDVVEWLSETESRPTPVVESHYKDFGEWKKSDRERAQQYFGEM